MSSVPYSWGRVLRACRALSDPEKLVWTEDAGLCIGPEGSYLGAPHLGQRLGKDADVVRAVRSRLKRLGLYRTVPRPGAKQALGWIPTLPERCRPSLKPSVREVELLCGELAAWVRENDPPLTRVTGTVNGDSRLAATVSPGARRGEGGKGGEAPTSSSESESSLQPAVTDLKATTKAEVGVFARANDRKVGELRRPSGRLQAKEPGVGEFEELKKRWEDRASGDHRG